MNLALVSTNKKKYSETFIDLQIKQLPFNIHLYSEGYLPSQFSSDKGQTFKDLPSGIFKEITHEEKLIKSFKKNKIDAVLTQYGPSGVACMPICKALNLPLYVHFHGFDAFRNDTLNSYGKHYKALFDFAKAIIVVSKDMLKQLLNLGCPKEKLHLIPYGVNTSFFKPNSTVKKEGFICVARLVEKKGHKYTILAFKNLVTKHPNAVLKLIGDGPIKNEISEFVRIHKLQKNVQFLGILTPKEVLFQLQRSIALVQHSIKTEENDSEGTPVSIMEAMACGLPIVATQHAGIVDLVDPDRNGFLVAEKDLAEMTKKMELVYENDLKNKEMGFNGREKIIKNYKENRYISDLSKLFIS